MEHYIKVKEENPDKILFYRVGDFYEMFMDDARLASQELDLVLTGKSAGVEENSNVWNSLSCCQFIHSKTGKKRL